MIFRDRKFVFNLRFISTKFFIPTIQRLLKIFGVKLVRNNEIYDDIKNYFKLKKELIILDVGAYRGNSIFSFKENFSNPYVYSFEPSKKNFNILRENCKRFSNYEIFNLGVSDINGIKKFNNNSWSETSSFIDLNDKGSKNYFDNRFKYLGKNITESTSNIETITIDLFLEKQNLDKVNILKIDTQGHEKNVLKGAQKSLKKNKIESIMIEIILDDYYKNQIHILDIEEYIINEGFYLYGIYDIIKKPKKRINQLDLLYIKNINQKK